MEHPRNPSISRKGSILFAPAAIAPVKCLHAKPNTRSNYKQNPCSSPNCHIKINLKPYHKPYPNALKKLRPEQMCHHRKAEWP